MLFTSPVTHRFVSPLARKTATLTALTALVLLPLASAQAYTFIDLAPFSGGNNCHAVDINNNRQVVGHSELTNLVGNFATHAVRWDLNTSGAIVSTADLGTFVNPTLPYDQSSSFGYAINLTGQMTGIASYSPSPAGGGWAFLYSGGVMTDIGAHGGPVTYGNDINDNGVIVGGNPYSGFAIKPFMWSSGSGFTNLGTLGTGDIEGAAVGINSTVPPLVVGTSRTSTSTTTWHAFKWQSGVMTDLTPSASNAKANQVNDTNRIVGYSDGNAKLWYNGTTTDLGPGAANDINESNVIVGKVPKPGDPSKSIAVIWAAGATTPTYLLDPATNPTMSSSTAEAINDDGWIAGYVTYTNGKTRGFVLKP